MTQRIPNVFANTVQKSMGWLHEIESETGWNEQRSYRALRATLHALRDRLTVDQAAHLGAQLPMLVRGFYYEGWHPAGVPDKHIHNCGDFLECVRAETDDPGLEPETAARAVFTLLARHVTEGEMRKVREQLPKSIWRLFAEGNGAPKPGAERPPGDSTDFIAGPDGLRAVEH